MSATTPPQRQPPQFRRTAPIRPRQPASDHLMPPPTGPVTPPRGPQITPPGDRTAAQLMPSRTAPIASRAAPSLHAVRPHAAELLFHPFKTLYFVAFLLADRRVGFFRKLLFLGPLALLTLAVLLPESLIAGVMGLLLPLVGLALNIPIDAGLDWILVALAAGALLRVFPASVVYEYHAQLFHRPPRAAK